MRSHHHHINATLLAHRTYLGGLDGLDLPRTRHQLDRLRGVVGDLDLVDKDVLVFQGVALLRVVLAAHLNPIPHGNTNKNTHTRPQTPRHKYRQDTCERR